MITIYKKIVIQMLIICLFSTLSYSEFTLGLYGIKKAEDIVNARKAGFNCIQSYESNPETIQNLAYEAAKNEISLIVYPNEIVKSEKYKKNAVNYPIKAWYLFDEPDVWKYSRKDFDFIK